MYEIGQWVRTDEGIGQIIWVRPFSACKIFKLTDYRKQEIDDAGNYMYKYIIKYFCNHDFQILRNFRIESSRYPEKISKNQAKKIRTLKEVEKQAYFNYIVFDQFHLPLLHWELFYSIKRQDVLGVKKDLSEFKCQVKGNYFTVSDLDLYLRKRESMLCLERTEDRSSVSIIDKNEYKILVLQFFTTTENKIVNGEICLIDFNNLWR